MIARVGSATVVTLALACAACSQFEAPPDRYYRIDIVSPPSVVGQRFTRPLEVETPGVDGLLTGRPIVYAEAGNSPALLESRYNFWDAPPAVMVRDQLVSCLEAAGVANEIVTERTRVAAPYAVVGRLQRLEQTASQPPHAVVELKLGIRDNSANRLLLWRTYSADVAAGNDNVPAVVAAFSTGFSDICRRFTADLAGI